MMLTRTFKGCEFTKIHFHNSFPSLGHSDPVYNEMCYLLTISLK